MTTTADSGAGSLRQAITDANATAGADNINFAIPGAGPHTITLVSLLPPITSPVTIDGNTQTGSSPNSLAVGNNAVLMVHVTTAALLSGHALHLSPGSGGSVIRGLVMNGPFIIPGNRGALIRIEQSDGNTIAGNFLGTDPTGTTSVPSGNAIEIINASNNTVGGAAPAARNLIAGDGGIVSSSSPPRRPTPSATRRSSPSALRREASCRPRRRHRPGPRH